MSVVGNTGSGKSTLGRALALRLGVPYVELDAIRHLPNWVELDEVEFHRKVESATAGTGWVIDGNYRTVVVEGPVWERADTVVWLDLSRAATMRQLTARTLRRAISREELWNGNRERPLTLLRMDPRVNIIRWGWTQHAKYAARFGSAMTAPSYAHLEFVRLRSRAEAEAWVAAVG